MNSLDFSLFEIKVMRYIKWHDSCTPQALRKKLGDESIATAYKLHRDNLIFFNEDTQRFSIRIHGMELLKDYRLRQRSGMYGHLIDAAIALVSAIIGALLTLI